MIFAPFRFLTRYWINIALVVLVVATFYNSWDLERTNDEVIAEAKADRQESNERITTLISLVAQLQNNYDELAESREEDQRLHKELLVWLRTIGVIVPERFIPKETADPSTVRGEGNDRDGDGRRDVERRPDGGDSGKAPGRDSGKGNSGNGSNNGGGNNSGGGSNDDDGPGKSEDSHKGGNDKDKGKGNDKNKDKGKGKDK